MSILRTIPVYYLFHIDDLTNTTNSSMYIYILYTLSIYYVSLITLLHTWWFIQDFLFDHRLKLPTFNLYARHLHMYILWSRQTLIQTQFTYPSVASATASATLQSLLTAKLRTGTVVILKLTTSVKPLCWWDTNTNHLVWLTVSLFWSIIQSLILTCDPIERIAAGGSVWVRHGYLLRLSPRIWLPHSWAQVYLSLLIWNVWNTSRNREKINRSNKKIYFNLNY